jgi:hypothetical protein
MEMHPEITNKLVVIVKSKKPCTEAVCIPVHYYNQKGA